LNQILQGFEGRVHEESLHLLRVEAEARRAKESFSSDVKAIRDVVNLFANDIRDIREVQQSQAKQIEFFLASRAQETTSKYEQIFANFEAQLNESTQQNIALTKRIEMLERFKDEQNQVTSEEIDHLKSVTSTLSDRSTSVETALTDLSRMVETSSQSILHHDKDVRDRMEEFSQLCENITITLQQDRLALNEQLRSEVANINVQMQQLASDLSSNSEVEESVQQLKHRLMSELQLVANKIVLCEDDARRTAELQQRQLSDLAMKLDKMDEEGAERMKLSDSMDVMSMALNEAKQHHHEVTIKVEELSDKFIDLQASTSGNEAQLKSLLKSLQSLESHVNQAELRAADAEKKSGR
jgi:DNA repair exonuclease SbcCD ATPase subunit